MKYSLVLKYGIAGFHANYNIASPLKDCNDLLFVCVLLIKVLVPIMQNQDDCDLTLYSS